NFYGEIVDLLLNARHRLGGGLGDFVGEELVALGAQFGRLLVQIDAGLQQFGFVRLPRFQLGVHLVVGVVLLRRAAIRVRELDGDDALLDLVDIGAKGIFSAFALRDFDLIGERPDFAADLLEFFVQGQRLGDQDLVNRIVDLLPLGFYRVLGGLHQFIKLLVLGGRLDFRLDLRFAGARLLEKFR